MEASLSERILKAKEKLRNVSTTVTFEDGSSVEEQRDEGGSIIRKPNETNQGDSITGTSNRQRKKLEFKSRLGFIVDLKPDLQVAQVSPGLYVGKFLRKIYTRNVGSQDVAADFSLLKSSRITHIVNCATGVRNMFPQHFIYLTVEVLDLPTTKISKHFTAVHKFIEDCLKSNGNVFVHCNAGISRSTTFVVSYLMCHEGYTLESAIQHIRSIRPAIRPNDGFMEELRQYETILETKK